MNDTLKTPISSCALPTKSGHEPSHRGSKELHVKARRIGRRFGISSALVVLGCAVIVAVWAAVIERIAFENAETIATVTKQNESLARTLEEHTVRTLLGVDQVLHFIMYQYGQQGLGLSVRKAMTDAEIDDSIFTDIAVIDEHGTRVLGRDAAKPFSVADREYFKFHQRADSHNLFISQPALGRLTGKWTIHMSRRINHPDGSFGGVALAAVDPAYFTNFYQETELGEHGLVVLVGLDGISRARQVGAKGSFGEDMRGGTLMGKQAKNETGSFISVGRLDGTPRFYSFRTLRRYPLIVAVGTSEAATLAPVRERARNYRIFAAIATACGILFVAGALIALWRQWRAAAKHESHIEHLATHDALTDLPNRNLLNDRITQAISHAKRAELGLAVIFVDLDHFKYVNDAFGHRIGDELLKVIAQELRALVRSGDTVARLGGDEFVLLLDDVKDAAFAATTISQKALQRFSQPFVVGTREFTVTASLGISLYPGDGQDHNMLLMNADAAMYHAKEAGCNTFQFSAPEMKNKAIERVALEAALRRALQLQQFELHYQPLVVIATGETIGMEALIRWRHPDAGLVSPAQFIPIAEETGLIIPIGEWVLRTACAQNKAWQDAGFPPLTVSINLSALQLRQAGLVELVARVLDETGLEARYLDLELTETMVMGKSQSAIECMHALKALGVTLSLDDFGTGYSNLGYLKSFPLDQLKIDRSFVHDLPESSNAASIARAIVSMGHSLGLRVVAEGVETAAQAQFLASIWCEHAQGYFYSKPLPAAEFALWLVSGKSMGTTALASDCVIDA